MRRREHGDAGTIRAVLEFLGRHEELRGVVETGAYRNFSALLARVDRQAAEQVSQAMAGKSATQTALAAREDLIEHHMKHIHNIARVLETEHPELQSLRIPENYMDAGTLVAIATGMGVEAGKWKDDFVEAGLPTDFIERMNAAIQRFRDANAQPKQHRASRSGATEGAQVDLRQAKKYLKVMDTFVRRTVPNNAALLAEWKAVKRFPPRKKAQADIPQISAPPTPLMLPASAEPIQLTAHVEEEPAKAPARWTLRGLFRT